MVAGGEPAVGFEQLVATRWAALYRTAYLLTGQQGDAEDVLQSTLVKAFGSWRKVARAESPEAYVRRMLVNEFISTQRRRRRAREHTARQRPAEPAPAHEESVADRVDLWPQVRALAPRQRAVVVLRYYEDLSERQIAETLGCSVGTVKSQAAQALRTLRARLRMGADAEGSVQ